MMKQRHANERFDSKIKAIWFMPDDAFEFVSLPYQRQISQHHTNNIRDYLEKIEEQGGTPHFNEPLVVNSRGDKGKGKVALLDGYHRWEAMKKFNKPVKIKIEIYVNLNTEEEKQLYEDYNIGKKHTTLDVIRPRIEGHKALKELMKNSAIPLTVYINRNKGISVSAFLNSYKLQLAHNPFKKGTATKSTLSKFIMEDFDEKQADKLVRWTKWFTNIVGEYHPQSQFYHRNVLSVCMYAYWTTMRPDVFETKLRDFKFDAHIKEILSTSSGFAGFRALLPAFKDRINKHLRTPII